MTKKALYFLAVLIILFLTAMIPLKADPQPQVSAPTAFAFDETPQPFSLPTPLSSRLPYDPSAVHGLYFYSTNCPHCMTMLDELVLPMQDEFGSKLDIRLIEISYTSNYELLNRAEKQFGVQAEKRGIPTLIIGSNILIGESPIRDHMREIVTAGIDNGGVGWPAIVNFDPDAITTSESSETIAEMCTIENADVCETGEPIYAAYFFQTGCQSCSRVEADLAYLHSKYPQLIVEIFNIYDHTGLGTWLAERAGRDDFHIPALFIGSQAWIGDTEITPQAIESTLKDSAQKGSPRFWDAYDETTGSENMVKKFHSMSWLTVVFAGLVDGVNPCAFATLIFFVSYLTLSGRKGNEVLLVGSTFTLGVFLAYLIIGFGFYKVLDLLSQWLTILGHWVYGITAALCLVLAFFSFLDFLKVRHGELSDMSLKLPDKLRKRINAIIRKSRNIKGYAFGAFITGLVIALLELACTGQIYLPTIIFVSSIPELRLQAIFYLLIYNLLFILPLVVVFIMAYYGTTSKDLTQFLKKNSASVKLGMTLLFLSLGIWLIFTLIR